MRAVIAVLPGDGVGPEVTSEAVRALRAIAGRFDHHFEFVTAAIGGEGVDADDDPLPKRTLACCRAADAVLLGAVGGPAWDELPAEKRPEQGLLRLRKELGLFANIRPVRVHPALIDRSPLRSEIVAGADLIVVRELTGGIYFGRRTDGDQRASDTCTYSVQEIERITRAACAIAMRRRGHITSVDKANVLATSRLWRKTVERVVGDEFPDITLEHMLVDAASMHLIQSPTRFDVLLTENMFGDILSDESSVIAGSMGLLPSASMGPRGVGLFEPIHGSAPDIAARNVANPYGAIASAAMLLRIGLGLIEEAELLERAIDGAIRRGALTADLCGGVQPGCSTRDAGEAVTHALRMPRLGRSQSPPASGSIDWCAEAISVAMSTSRRA